VRKTALDPSRFSQTLAVLDQAIAEGVIPGAALGVWEVKNPDQFLIHSSGQRRVVPSSLPMFDDTVFDWASLSKVMGTSLLAARLKELGQWDWSKKVGEFFPESPAKEVTLGSLARHESGLNWWEPFWKSLHQEFGEKLATTSIAIRQERVKQVVLTLAPKRPEGQAVEYSDVGFLLLGFVLEKICGQSLDRAIAEMVFEPLKMKGAHYVRVERSALEALEDPQNQVYAATEACPWRGAVLQGQVHDDNAWAIGGFGAHAGVFGRLEDLITGVAGLFQGGLLSQESLNSMWDRSGNAPESSRTLGWDTPSGEQPSASSRFALRSVGHLGFTGTSLWIDRDAGLAVALLTNRVHPSRTHDGIRALRPQLHAQLRIDLGY
jgi:CubicO group peptidase (beta-lactamase class C family)